jgi:hypothetical protein
MFVENDPEALLMRAPKPNPPAISMLAVLVMDELAEPEAVPTLGAPQNALNEVASCVVASITDMVLRTPMPGRGQR